MNWVYDYERKTEQNKQSEKASRIISKHGKYSFGRILYFDSHDTTPSTVGSFFNSNNGRCEVKKLYLAAFLNISRYGHMLSPRHASSSELAIRF